MLVCVNSSRDQDPDFYVETLAGKNHGRTKAQVHYDRTILQAQDGMPSLGATKGNSFSWHR
jgi:hypothetical protein